MKKVIVAIDSFKGCLTSVEANQAASEGILARMPDAAVVQVPVSDGGEGFMEAFQAAMGGEIVEVNVKDPLMRTIAAQYLMQGDTAVIEIAKASGLTLLSPDERNPMVATSYGTGQLVVNAVRRGCKHIIVGLGGSATSDCGIGMLRAIIDAFAKHGNWDDVRELDDVHFTIATDVTNPLCGDLRPRRQKWLRPLMLVPNALRKLLPNIWVVIAKTILVQVQQAAWAMLFCNT